MKMTRQCFVTFQEAFTTSAFTLHRQYREIKIVHIVKGQMPSKFLVNENKQGYHKEIHIESNAFVVISIVNHVIWHVGMFVIFKYHHYSGLYTWHTHDLCHFHPQETIPTIFTSSDLRPGCQVRRKKWRCWKPPARDTWQLQQFSSFFHIFMFISLSYNEEITVTSSDVCSCW